MSEVGITDVLDINKFTKITDPRGRSETARSIWEKRSQINSELSEKRNQKRQFEERDQELGELERSIISSKQERSDAKDTRSNSLWGRVLAKLRIPDRKIKQLDADIQQQDDEWTKNHLNQSDIQIQLNETSHSIDQLKQSRQDLRNEAKDYYQKWQFDVLTPEQKKELFKPEILKTLTTQEYLELWRRGSPYFLSHVTRQGFRDHNAMFYHRGGMNQFAEGFTKCLSDERILRSPIYLQGLKGLDEESITTYLQDLYLVDVNLFPEGPLSISTPDEAKKKFLEVFNHTLASAPSFPDKRAVHLAAEIVADSHYGGETGNEIFFIFPADFIASQYSFAFNGWEKDFTKPQSERKWNDIFVWTGQEKGISLDSGFVFLPKDAKVDPQTGSRYASKIIVENGVEKRAMVEDPNASLELRNWLTTNIDNLNNLQRELHSASGTSYYDHTYNRAIERVNKELVTQGWDENEASVAAEEIIRLHRTQPDIDLWEASTFDKIVKESGKIYKKPDVTITSEDYWQKFFADNPDKKPAHILFYSGDPTTAVYNTLQNEGITKRGDKNDPLLGFGENHITDMRDDPRSREGYDKVIEIANKLIEEHYTKLSHALTSLPHPPSP